MRTRWKVAIGAGLVACCGIGFVLWYGLRDGGPLPSRASLRQQWVELAQAQMPVPKAGEPDGWALLAEATKARKEIDRALWKPDDPESRPRPDFGLIAAAPGPAVARASETDDDATLRAQELALAERCLEAYRSKGVIEKIDALAGVRTGRAPDVLPPEGEPLANTLKPHLGDLRACARINAARMRLAVRSGDLEEFSRAYRSNMSVARMAASGATLIDRLVGVAVESMTVSAALGAVAAHPQEPWLAAVEAEIDSGVAGVPFAHAVRGERVWGIDGVLFAKLEGSFGIQRIAVDAVALVSGSPSLGSPAENVAEMERLYEAAERVMAHERHQRAQHAADSMSVLNTPPRLRLTQLLTPAFGKSIDAEDQARLRRLGLRLSVAVERFRLAQGRLPGSLAELGPVVAVSAVDPWSGRALGYRPATEGDGVACGYVLYSVGHDGTDDGGKRRAGSFWFEPLSAKGSGFDAVVNAVD